MMCLCILRTYGVIERKPCTESPLCQLNQSGCDRDCSEQLEERRCFFISPPALLLRLWSPSLFSSFDPFLGLFLIVLLCPSGALFTVFCHCKSVCVCVGVCGGVPESQIKLLLIFGARDHFQVSAHILICPYSYILSYNTFFQKQEMLYFPLFLHAWIYVRVAFTCSISGRNLKWKDLDTWAQSTRYWICEIDKVIVIFFFFM